MIDAGLLAALELRLQEILQAQSQGLTEYQLIGALQSGDRPLFEDLAFSDSAQLFRAHFLLFHVLYRLRDRLLAEHRATLHIEPLRIQWLDYCAGGRGQVAEPDPLRAYYLDLDQLHDTSAHDIESMLGRFWSRLYAEDHRREALAALGLQEPVSYAAVRARYRELVMRHHPDRGGATERLQELNHAMAILARAYAH